MSPACFKMARGSATSLNLPPFTWKDKEEDCDDGKVLPGQLKGKKKEEKTLKPRLALIEKKKRKRKIYKGLDNFRRGVSILKS